MAGNTYSASREPLIYLNQISSPRSKLADPARWGGFEDVTSEAGFEAKASHESRAGLGRCRFDIFTGGGRVGSGCTGEQWIADAKLFTEPSAHSRWRGNRRHQSGDLLCIRQGSRGSGSHRRTASLGCPVWRLSRLSRLPGLRGRPCLPLRLRWMWRRVGGQLLRVMGCMPVVLNQRSFCRLSIIMSHGRVRQGSTRLFPSAA